MWGSARQHSGVMGELNWAGVELGSTHSPAPSFPCGVQGAQHTVGRADGVRDPQRLGTLLRGPWYHQRHILEALEHKASLGFGWWVSSSWSGSAQTSGDVLKNIPLGTRGREGHPYKVACEAGRRGGHLVVGVWHGNSAPSPWLLLWHLHCVQVRSCVANNLWCFCFCFLVGAPEWKMLPSLPLFLAGPPSDCVILAAWAFLPGSFSPQLPGKTGGTGFSSRTLGFSRWVPLCVLRCQRCLSLVVSKAKLRWSYHQWGWLKRAEVFRWAQLSLWLWEQMKPLPWVRGGLGQQEHTTRAGEKDWIQEHHETHLWHWIGKRHSSASLTHMVNQPGRGEYKKESKYRLILK